MCFTLVHYVQEHQLKKNQAAKFPAILDSFYLVLAQFQQGWAAGAEGGKVLSF